MQGSFDVLAAQLPRGCSFCGDKRNQKRFSAEGFFAARAFAANQAKPGLRSFCACFARATLQQKFAMPCRAPATIVLPGFGRS